MNAQACLRTPAAGESHLAEPEQTLPSAAAQLTEKWKPPKIVLPGEIASSSIVRLTARIAGQPEGLELLTSK